MEDWEGRQGRKDGPIGGKWLWKW